MSIWDIAEWGSNPILKGAETLFGADSGGGGGGGGGFNSYNPGQIDINQANPYLSSEVQSMKNLRDWYQRNNSQYLDKSIYDRNTSDFIDRSNTRLQNRLANSGLGGSALEVGSLGENTRLTNQQREDAYFNRSNQFFNMERALTGDIYRGVQGIQGQFGSYQNALLNAYMGQQAQEAAQQAALIGAIGTIGGAVAGGMVAGPVGAGAGAAAGRSMFGGAASPYGQIDSGSYVDNNYQMPDFGSSSGFGTGTYNNWGF